MRITILGALVIAVLLAAGCARRPAEEIPEGCSAGEAVPAGVREDVESTARRFYDLAREGNWTAIYGDAAEAVRTQRSQEAFVTPIMRTMRELGAPADPATEALSVVRFGPDFPYRVHVECASDDRDRPAVLLLNDFPLQASLVQRVRLGGEDFYYSTLWYGEDSGWKLAGFFAKPASLLGKDWKAYEALAAAELEAKNLRNAALLYNVAIDLVVPSAWIKPPEVDLLQGRQSRISVSSLPKGVMEPWPVPPDTLKVHQVAYGVAQNALAVVVRYEAPVALADTAAQAAFGERLTGQVRERFPEYGRVFRYLALIAFDPANPARSWSRLYPLEAGR